MKRSLGRRDRVGGAFRDRSQRSSRKQMRPPWADANAVEEDDGDVEYYAKKLKLSSGGRTHVLDDINGLFGDDDVDEDGFAYKSQPSRGGGDGDEDKVKDEDEGEDEDEEGDEGESDAEWHDDQGEVEEEKPHKNSVMKGTHMKDEPSGSAAPIRSRQDPLKPAIDPTAQPATQVKYVPPRARASTEEDKQTQAAKRTIRGLVNRVSQANISSIVNELEALYRTNPRNLVTSTVTDTVIQQVTSRSNLLESFVLVLAAALAALYKVIGPEVGAHFVQTLVEKFDAYCEEEREAKRHADPSVPRLPQKEAPNLIVLVTELYNFQVVSCHLLYDLIRTLLVDIDELNTELLLRVVRNCGPQLRSDDPSALKEIIIALQKSMARLDESQVTPRTQFMVETIYNLKNNKTKANSAQASTQALNIQMKRYLGGLGEKRTLRATEPLRVRLHDIRDHKTKGKWWLVGASWKSGAEGVFGGEEEAAAPAAADEGTATDGGSDEMAHLMKLARKLRMNTDVRRAVFVTIMSSTDAMEAYEKLNRLRLKKSQELEIPKVLLQCLQAEKSYNPYYAQLAQRLCLHSHALKKAFQFGLWDFFTKLGEQLEEDAPLASRTDMPLRKVVNMASCYARLVSNTVQPITILKVLALAQINRTTATFVELLLTKMFQHIVQVSESPSKAVAGILSPALDLPDFAADLAIFLRAHVAHSPLLALDLDAVHQRQLKELVRDARVLLRQT